MMSLSFSEIPPGVAAPSGEANGGRARLTSAIEGAHGRGTGRGSGARDVLAFAALAGATAGALVSLLDSRRLLERALLRSAPAGRSAAKWK